MMTLARLLTGTLLIASLAMLGCGDDGGDDGGGGGDPTADFMMDPSCTDNSSTQVSFTSTSSDAEDGTDLQCSWTFGSCTAPSGCSSTSCTPTGVTFPSANPYSVTLIVTDSDGNTDSLQQTIGPC